MKVKRWPPQLRPPCGFGTTHSPCSEGCGTKPHEGREEGGWEPRLPLSRHRKEGREQGDDTFFRVGKSERERERKTGQISLELIDFILT